MTTSRRAWLPALAALTSVAFASAQAARLARAARAAALSPSVVVPSRPGRPQSRADIGAAVSAAAPAAGVRQVLSVTLAGGGGRDALIEWDADLPSSLRFLTRLRDAADVAVTRVSLTSGDGESALHGRAGLAPATDAVREAIRAPERNPFRPLWAPAVRFARLASDNRRREEERQRREVARADADRQTREAGERRAAAQHDFAGRFTLTGIVTDARGPLAFLTVDHQRSVLARAGDRVDGATVAAIDGGRGEAMLTGADAMSVILRVGAP